MWGGGPLSPSSTHKAMWGVHVSLGQRNRGGRLELPVLSAASEAVLWRLSLDIPETCGVRLFPWAPIVDQSNPFKSPQIPSAGYACFPENTKAAIRCQTGCGSCFFVGGLPQRRYTLYVRWSEGARTMPPPDGKDPRGSPVPMMK